MGCRSHRRVPKHRRIKYFPQHRLDWITETLRVFGFINRTHIMRKFGISAPLASSDLQLFDRSCPGTTTYNASEKCHRVIGGLQVS